MEDKKQPPKAAPKAKEEDPQELAIKKMKEKWEVVTVDDKGNIYGTGKIQQN